MVPTINHWVGNAKVVRQFRTALEASWNDGVRLPHMLLVCSPGLGKSELAYVAARELGVTMHERLSQVISNAALMNGLLLGAVEKEIVFLDEVHELPPGNQTILYHAMQGRQITIQTRENQTLKMPLNDLTIIGATTDEFRLLTPLRDRFKMILSFVPYDIKALTTITLCRAQQMEINIQGRVAYEIAKRSRGTPRCSIKLLESCHRYARSEGDEDITIEHFEQTMDIDQIDSLGLGTDAQRYLKFVGRRHGSPVRLFTIESSIGVHRRTIQTVIGAHNTAASGASFALFGRSDSTAGLGVFGWASATTGTTHGVWGQSNSTDGRGVFGFAATTSGVNYGVFGQSNSTRGFDFFAAGAGTNYGSESSIRWKSNIRNIDQPLDKIARLRGVYFD